MIRSMSYNRNFRIPNPMLTGSASVPTPAAPSSTLSAPVGLLSHTKPTAATMNTVAPLSSHFSCRRRSPDERR